MPDFITSGEDAYTAFAPDGGAWSDWVKPTAFAHFDGKLPAIGAGDLPRTPLRWLPPADGTAAVVFDLPGEASVVAGVVAAEAGYRPVPLFNGGSGDRQNKEVVDTADLRANLRAAAAVVRDLDLPADAPPAFLLDRDRARGSPVPGRYDNRWVTLPQDWPSANLILSRGITTCVLVHPPGTGMRDDLAHVLRRWQEAGVEMRQAPWDGAATFPLTVRRPSRFRSTWHRLLVAAGLRRGSAGGFGGVVPEPGEGGGFA